VYVWDSKDDKPATKVTIVVNYSGKRSGEIRSKSLGHSGWNGGRGYLSMSEETTRRRDERFVSVRGECEILKL
jgi:hypothetical protein